MEVTHFEDPPAGVLADIHGCSPEQVEELISAVQNRWPEYTDITIEGSFIQFAYREAAAEAA